MAGKRRWYWRKSDEAAPGAVHESGHCGGIAHVREKHMVRIDAAERRRLMRRGWWSCRRCRHMR